MYNDKDKKDIFLFDKYEDDANIDNLSDSNIDEINDENIDNIEDSVIDRSIDSVVEDTSRDFDSGYSYSKVNIDIDIKKEYNYLNYQCDVFYKIKNNVNKQTPYSLIEEIIIDNDSDVDLTNLVLSFEVSNDLISIANVYISSVSKNSKSKITEGIQIKVNSLDLYKVSEPVPVNLFVKLYAGDLVISEKSYDIIITPMNEASSISYNPEQLACFVTPNASDVVNVIKLAKEELNEIRKCESDFIGYQANDIDSVREEMMAIYNALKKVGINYSNPPSSFNLFQTVRIPEEVLTNKFGTCLDLSILYCACLECVGLNPLLIIIDGHAFAGCFLEDTCFVEKVCHDPSKVFNLSAEDNMSIELVECTMLAKSSDNNFNSSNTHARNTLRYYCNVFSAIDIAICHKGIYRPIPTRKVDEFGNVIEPVIDFESDDLKKKQSEVNKEVYVGEEVNDKFNYWSKKLLDLSLRNKLINFILQPSAPQILFDAKEMLPNLNKDNTFYLYPNGEDMKKNHYFVFDLDDAGIKNNAKRKIYTICAQDQTVRKLIRSGLSSIEETGSNNLYLSFGILNFVPKLSKKNFIAPIFIAPVKGKNRRTSNGYEITIDLDNISINTTVFEYLNQLYGISFEELYNIDREVILEKLPNIFNTIRGKTTSDCFIGVDDDKVFLSVFSFANFIIWEDIHNRKDQLLENKIIKCLVDGVQFNENSTEVVIDSDSIDDINPTDIAIPLSADSSQIKAIIDCANGKSFVLDGPPGTGKSQTIVNMIVNAMYRGKSVLFVAEKMAALEVVKKRIDDINLGSFCLELHSNKTNKKDFLEQVSKALEFSHTSSPKMFEKSLSELKEKQDYLNDFIKKIHHKKYNLSLADAIAKYFQYEEYNIDFKDYDKIFLQIDENNLNDIIDIFAKMSLITKSYGEYSESVFNCFDIIQYNSFIDKKDLELKISSLYESVYKFSKLISDFKSIISYENDLLSLNNVNYLIEMIKLILTKKLTFNTLLTKDIYLNHDSSLIVIDKGIKFNALKKKLLATFRESILSINSSILEYDYYNANFITKIFALNRIKKELKMHLNDPRVKLDKHYMLSVLNDVSLYKKYREEISSSNAYLAKLFGSNYENLEDNFELLNEYYLNTVNFKQNFDKLIFNSSEEEAKVSLLSSFIDLYNKLNVSDIIEFKLNNIIESFNKCKLLEDDLHTSYKINTSKFKFKGSYDYYNEYSILLNKMTGSVSNIEGIVLYNKAFNDLYDRKVLNKIIEFYKTGKCSVYELPKYFYSYYYYYILREYFYDEYFQEFNGVVFDDAIRKYNELLDSYTELIILETASKVTKNYPINDFEYAKSSKIYGLQRCIKNNGYKTTIRNVLKEYGELIRSICPVFLMSPISAAQYLSLDSEKFDIVIFDEASQILTAEAIGAISRGDSLVVAGDPEQMPPTTFFKSFIESSEEDVLMNIDDLESLLDDALALGMKRNRLLWHYRSTHESLIAFSNNTFYDHSLFTFPSPDNTLCKVSYNYVNNAIYDHGVNEAEADEIVKEVVRRFDDPVLCKDSIGIVTFNIKQKELILDKLTEIFDKNPKYYEINENNPDKLFVKNLENVQGDERDCIIFSIGFGYDKNHKFNHFFGPLSLEKGERRLNVAVTRSKKEMIVFASIHSGDIKAERAKNRGAEVLKQFLMYAEVGPSCLIIENKNQFIAQGGIEQDIKEEIAKLGYDCDILVGDSKFKINVCVKNDSGEYILGILIDGGVSSLDSTCRDRNTVQIKTLQRLNWNVINIYSVDYIKDREKVLDRIIECTKNHNVILENSDKPMDLVFEHDDIKLYKRAKAYKKYIPQQIINYDLIEEEAPNMNIIKQLQLIIDYEGPIAYSLLLDRFKKMIGVSKVGARVKRLFDINLTRVERTKFKELSEVVYFPLNQNPNIDYYRKSSSTDRDISQVPCAEIKQAIIDVLEVNGRIKTTDLISQIGNFFGFKVMTQATREKINNAIKYILDTSDIFKYNSEFISLK